MSGLRFLLLVPLLLACSRSEPPPGMTAAPGMTAVPGTAVPGTPGAAGMPGAAGVPAASAAPNPFAILGQMAQMAQGMTAQGGVPGARIVNWRELGNAIPASVQGWEADGDLSGSTGSMGALGASNARRRFRQGERRLSFEVADTSFNQMLVMPFNMARAITVDSSTEIKRASDVQGQPGYLEFRYRNHEGKQVILAHGRFIVTTELRPSQQPQEVVTYAGLVNHALLGQLHAASQMPAAGQAPATAAP